VEQESYSLRQSLCVLLFSSTFLCAMEPGFLCIKKQELGALAIKSHVDDALQDLSSCAYTLHEKLFSNVDSADAQKALWAIQAVMQDVFDGTKKSQGIEHREHLECWQRLGYREELADDCAYIEEIFEHTSPAAKCSDEMRMFMTLLEKQRAACWFPTMQDNVEPWLDDIMPYFGNPQASTQQTMALQAKRESSLERVVAQKKSAFIFSLVFELLERDDPIPTIMVAPATPRT